MKAVQVSKYGGPEILEVVDAAVPVPGDKEIRIDVRAAGINFADIEKRRGNYLDGPEPPYRPGLEVAGVVETSSQEADLTTGDRAVALTTSGGYAEYAVAPIDAVIRLPKECSFVEGAALPVQWLTAHNALFEWGGLSAGERLLVTAAAGGVGTAAVQLATEADAVVIGVASTEEKREQIRSVGAEHAITYDEIEKQTVDLGLDGVGGSAFTDTVEALAPGGRVVTYGMASGHVPTVATPRLFFENKSVIGYHLEEALDRTPDRVLSAVPNLIESVSTGAVDVVIGDTFPLTAATEAHRNLQERESYGKLVLVPRSAR